MNSHHKDDGENQKNKRLVDWARLQKSFSHKNLAADKPNIWHIIVPLGLATALHTAIFLLVSLFEQPAVKNNRPLQAQITFIEPKKRAAKNPLDPRAQKQVVAVAPSPQPKRPEQARYFAESDQSTQKEQAAASTSLDPPNLSAAPEKMGQLMPKPQVVHEAPSMDDYLKPKAPMPNDDPLGIMPSDPGNSFRDAMPFADNLADVAKGDKTELNTWQWLHAPFFNRIKTKVAKVWSPQRQIALYDPTGALIGQKDRTTVIRVSIDRAGFIQSISVLASSGVAYLDEEAEHAFRAAAPFPFPPKELFDANGLFAFDFSFHLQIDNGISLHFDWNPAS